jgi:hypothetical protein
MVSLKITLLAKNNLDAMLRWNIAIVEHINERER